VIIIIVGGIGCGKTLFIMRELIIRRKAAFVNFQVRDIPRIIRMKWDYILQEDEVMNDKGKPKRQLNINWDFWKRMQPYGFDIHWDEIHNAIPSRRGMSKRNMLLNQWLSQIRKIMGDSKLYNLYCITQRPKSIDIHFRYMAHMWLKPQFMEYPNILVPTQVWENDRYVLKELPFAEVLVTAYHTEEDLEYGSRPMPWLRFPANPLYRYYDSYGIVEEIGNEVLVP